MSLGTIIVPKFCEGAGVCVGGGGVQGSLRGGQEAEGANKPGQGPALWFPWEGMHEAADRLGIG